MELALVNAPRYTSPRTAHAIPATRSARLAARVLHRASALALVRISLLAPHASANVRLACSLTQIISAPPAMHNAMPRLAASAPAHHPVIRVPMF